MKLRLDRRWVYIASVSILFAVTAFLLTVISARRDPVAAADSLRKAGRYSEALDQYQDLLARDPDNERALWGVAQTHLARHDPPMAIEYLNRYLQKHPRGERAADARQALEQVRAALVAGRKPSPELAPGAAPTISATPSSQLSDQWQEALTLEGRGALLDAIAIYAGIAQTTQDPRVRAACLERVARCEARRPPFDFDRIRHFYLEASRAYRDLDDWQNSARCQELAYLAQEYARVSAERKKLAEEAGKIQASRPKEEEPKEPTPQETYATALEAYRSGSYDEALAVAEKLVGALPDASFVLGMVHLRQGLWDDAGEELARYVQEVPNGASADEARAQLEAIKGKHLLLLDHFDAVAKKWQLVGAEPGTPPPTERLSGAAPSDGPCLKLEPRQGAYASFDEARVATIEIRFYDPPEDAAPLPGLTIRLYSQGANTCAPLIVSRRGYRFASQGAISVPHSSGWRRLVIDVSTGTVTAHLDGRLIGETRREGGLSGISFQTEDMRGASALYVDEVQVVEPTS